MLHSCLHDAVRLAVKSTLHKHSPRPLAGRGHFDEIGSNRLRMMPRPLGANLAANGLCRLALAANRQGDPLLPGHWADVALAPSPVSPQTSAKKARNASWFSFPGTKSFQGKLGSPKTTNPGFFKPGLP